MGEFHTAFCRKSIAPRLIHLFTFLRGHDVVSAVQIDGRLRASIGWVAASEPTGGASGPPRCAAPEE